MISVFLNKRLIFILLLSLSFASGSKANPLLPEHRIVAYYGNFYSKHMGALGQYPPDEMLARLNKEVLTWEKVDPNTPVIPGIHYIAVTAQPKPGADGMYRDRMPGAQIQKAIALANQIKGIAILDIQLGHSTVEAEVSQLESYLVLPNVMLGLDPEFAMKDGAKPGERIGTMDATQINEAADYLASLVKKHNLPPKVLVIHRFTKEMVTDYRDVKQQPEVQVILDMDGWGYKAKKRDTYARVITSEATPFTGFKLFYINDLRPPSTGLLTPEEILTLKPKPLYILYQ